MHRKTSNDMQTGLYDVENNLEKHWILTAAIYQYREAVAVVEAEE